MPRYTLTDEQGKAMVIDDLPADVVSRLKPADKRGTDLAAALTAEQRALLADLGGEDACTFAALATRWRDRGVPDSVLAELGVLEVVLGFQASNPKAVAARSR